MAVRGHGGVRGTSAALSAKFLQEIYGPVRAAVPERAYMATVCGNRKQQGPEQNLGLGRYVSETGSWKSGHPNSELMV